MSSLAIEGGSTDLPLETTYKNMLEKLADDDQLNLSSDVVVEECELPLIDLNQLNMGEVERQACKKMIARASREWGFFQITNHGVSPQLVETMRAEQMKLFEKPFEEKKSHKDYKLGNILPPLFPNQMSWSEAFHILLSDNALIKSSSMELFALTVCDVARELSDILAEEMGRETDLVFKETCPPSSCFLRLNRYPACPAYISHHMLGLSSHTDSSYVTLLLQDDNVGGLQIRKDGKWIAVKPNPGALIVNIGDMFQAVSNDLYKSVEHRVVANPFKERLSAALFFCPPHDGVVQSGGVYRSFTFGEYKKQIEVDVRNTGSKVGLRSFLIDDQN